jgi:hypothetical protein
VDRSTKVAMGIGIGVALLLGCCISAIALPFVGCSRDFVVQPAVDVVARSAEGPLSDASVEHVWWSNPHGKVHGTASHPVAPDGRLELTKRLDEERIMPLCMHGVPEHQHQFCVEAEGFRPIGFIVRDHTLPVTGEIVLEPGEGRCHGQVGWGERLPSSLANADAFTILPAP